MKCGCVRGYRKLGSDQMNGNIFLGGQSASNFGNDVARVCEGEPINVHHKDRHNQEEYVGQT